LKLEYSFNPNKMYRVAYRYHATGYVGYGDYCLSYTQAQDWVERLNARHTDMTHWIEGK